MNADGFPVIRLELERMQMGIVTAITEHALQMDEQVKEAVKKFCTPENIQQILDAEVSRVLKQEIASTIDAYYKYGNGRKVIADLIKKKLDEDHA
jgi:uncharacterized protein with PIN domain